MQFDGCRSSAGVAKPQQSMQVEKVVSLLLTRAVAVAPTFTVVIGSVSRAKKGLFPKE